MAMRLAKPAPGNPGVSALLVLVCLSLAAPAAAAEQQFVLALRDSLELIHAKSAERALMVHLGPEVQSARSLVASADGRRVFVAGETAAWEIAIVEVDAAVGREVRTLRFDRLRTGAGRLSLDEERNRLLVAPTSTDGPLVPIDLALGLPMAPLAVRGCMNVTPRPVAGKLYASCFGQNGEHDRLTVFRASDLRVVAQARVGASPLGLALNPSGTRLYVATAGGVTVVNTLTNRPVARIGLLSQGRDVAVDPGGRRVYVTTGHDDGRLAVIDAARNAVARTIPVGAEPGAVAVSPDGTRAYVSSLRGGISVVDTTAGRMVGRVDGIPDGPLAAIRLSPVTHAFAVNSLGDAVDADPGDGACETAAGGGECTLRAAVQETNALPGMDTVMLPEGTFTLSLPGMYEQEAATGDLDVTDALTVRGASTSGSVVDGGALDRVFEVHRRGNLHLARLTLRNGRLPYRDHRFFDNPPGAAVYNHGGVLRLSQVDVTGNASEGLGGIVHSSSYGEVGGEATLFARDCAVRENDNSEAVTRYVQVPPGSGDWVEVTSVLEGPAILARYAELVRTTIADNDAPGARIEDGRLEECLVDANSSYLSVGGLSLQSASVVRSRITGNAGAYGGGVAGGRLIADSLVSGNRAEAPPASDVYTPPPATSRVGGGIQGFGGLEIVRTTVSGNRAHRGGGIYLAADHDPVRAVNSTVSGNTAHADGGGIFVAGGMGVELLNLTVTGNAADADDDGEGDGGGIFRTTETHEPTALANTLLAGNTDAGGEAPDCAGELANALFNIVGATDGCGFAATGFDVAGTAGSPVDPQLAPLADNGGPTPTHALLEGSPALDAGHYYLFPRVDQRGVRRPQGGRSDIGAFEAAGP